MEIVIIAIVSLLLVVGTVIHIFDKTLQAETLRFREYAKAVMAKDLNEYVEVMPEDEKEEEIEEQDEFEELDNVDEEKLIKVLRGE